MFWFLGARCVRASRVVKLNLSPHFFLQMMMCTMSVSTKHTKTQFNISLDALDALSLFFIQNPKRNWAPVAVSDDYSLMKHEHEICFRLRIQMRVRNLHIHMQEHVCVVSIAHNTHRAMYAELSPHRTTDHVSRTPHHTERMKCMKHKQ